MTDNLTGKISDLKKLSDERKQLTSSKKLGSPSRLNTASAPLLERPASRVEIHSLERELEERVRLVLDSSNFQRNPNEFGLEFSYQPHKENMMLTRERMLGELNATVSDLEHEPWLDSFVKCECLKHMCDDISSRFADMLGVNSTELGSVARKLRLTYKQSFEQMALSWKSLRKQFLTNESELSNLRKQIGILQKRLDTKEGEISERFDKEIARISREYQEEKERDQEKLAQAELKMDQMADTLKYLNGIFRAMQNDTSTLKTSDLHTSVTRLTKENEELKKDAHQLDSIKTQLYSSLNKIKSLEATQRTNQEEISRLNIQLQRREEVINHLMEKDTIRTAEIEKLQRISKMKDEEILAMDMKDVATSVLCIKCKKSLDDITNIRSTLMLEQSANPSQRLQCENYRILLPNLRNRKPNRTTPWIRSVIRSILLMKMKEDLSLHYLKCDTMTFPAYVYAWFKRTTDGITGTALTKLLVLCDEDRWGLYYGVKALHKEDSECSLFWSLLDETFGQDGLRFVLYCLSVILSIGGKNLWRQFGSSITHGASINSKLDDDAKVNANIWLDIQTAKEGVQMILVKALAPHLSDALDSIDALKVKPDDLLPPEALLASREDDHFDKSLNKTAASTAVRIVSDEPTHINLFTWLRIMLQQFHADQIHRNAAVRLMFETASVGAMTSSQGDPHSPTTRGGGGGAGTMSGNVTHVEYPQFQSICTTLFPYMSITEICSLYARCHHAGKRRVTAEIFQYEADILGLFAQALKLPTLPLLKQLNIREEIDILEGNPPPATTNPVPQAQSSSGGGGDDNKPIEFYTKKTLFTIRSKLATVVHRRFAGLLPGIRYMMKYVPERWKIVLQDAIDNTSNSLNDTFQKLKDLNKIFNPPPTNNSTTMTTTFSRNNTNAPTPESIQMEKVLFLDGVQPYLHYRRLLSLTLLIQSNLENPLLPTELFTAVVIRNNEETIEKSVLRLERIVESLESVIFSPSDMEIVNIPKRIINKYEQFEQARQVLIVRRIQTIFRKFMSKEVPIPRPVRQVMAAGYLTNTIHQEHLLNASSSTAATSAASAAVNALAPSNKFFSLPLKFREVYHEPWWAQANIANIYLYKISYDMKATQLGKEPITLPQAISSYFYGIWGSTDVAERSIQDLFVAIKSYRFNIPRLRLFACFLGDGRDLEESLCEILNSTEAMAIYFSLIFAVHRQLSKKREHMLKIATASKSSAAIGTKVIKPGSSYTIIETLFPSSENTFQRTDKREVWLMEADLLTAAAKTWAQQQQWLRGQINIFSDLPEKLRPDVQNRVDVDDFLWIMMVQWAKLEAYHVKKCMARGTLIEKSIFGTNTNSTAAATPAGGNNNNNPQRTPKNVNNNNQSTDLVTQQQQQQQVLKDGFLSRRMSVLPLYNLRSIVESIYRPEDGENLADTQHYATSYIKLIRSRRLILPQTNPDGSPGHASHLSVMLSQDVLQRKLKNIKNLDQKFGSEFQNLLKECVLWDTNLAFVDSPATPQDTTIVQSRRRSGLVTRSSAFIGRTSLANFQSLEGILKEDSSNQFNLAAILSASSNDMNSKSTKTDGMGDRPSIEEMISFYSSASIKLSHYADNTIIGFGAFPELVLTMAKTAFTTYQGPINNFLDKLTADANLSKELDVKNRIQAIRVHLLQVGEFFQSFEVANMSVRIYNFELLGAVEDLHDSYVERNRNLKLCNDSILKLQSLFSSISDLTVLTHQEFPRDIWQRGAKIHLDRAFVYNIATKNALL